MTEWPQYKIDFSAGTVVMGILNTTPDSFSDGGNFLDIDKAVAHAVRMAENGAAIIDIGAESTRPGSQPVAAAEQINRAIPVIEKLSTKIHIPVSIDTSNFEVAKAAVDAGAAMINDITALADERTANLAAEKNLAVVLMHKKGTPQTMQNNPQYQDVVEDVLNFLTQRAQFAQQCGIKKDNIFIDPGIGFGKTFEHNIALLKNLQKFVKTGCKVLLGTSRKRFLGQLTAKEEPAQRDFATAATVALAVKAGVSVVRVHNVEAIADVVKVANALRQ